LTNTWFEGGWPDKDCPSSLSCFSTEAVVAVVVVKVCFLLRTTVELEVGVVVAPVDTAVGAVVVVATGAEVVPLVAADGEVVAGAGFDFEATTEIYFRINLKGQLALLPTYLGSLAEYHFQVKEDSFITCSRGLQYSNHSCCSWGGCKNLEYVKKKTYYTWMIKWQWT
jgi:hypothetical protein